MRMRRATVRRGVAIGVAIGVASCVASALSCEFEFLPVAAAACVFLPLLSAFSSWVHTGFFFSF